MIKNAKVGDIVYFMRWDKTCAEGTITSLFLNAMSDYASVYDNNTGGTTQHLLSNLYKTRKECLEIIHYYDERDKNSYRSQIKSLEDLIRFMYEHNFRGEDSDLNAKQVAKEKAKAFLEIDLED